MSVVARVGSRLGRLAAVQGRCSVAVRSYRRTLDLESGDSPSRLSGDSSHVNSWEKDSASGSLNTETEGDHYSGPKEKSINNVTLLGRVGTHPQIRGTENKPVTTFSLATNNYWKDQDGDQAGRTDWHNIVVFNPYLSERAHRDVTKGARIHVTGKLRYGEYVDQAGVKRFSTSIVAEDIIFCGQGRQDN